MLQIQPTKWYSETYEISEDGRDLTEVNIRWSREAGSFRLGRDRFEVGRDGWMSGDYYLEHGGNRIASATKPSAWNRRFVLRHKGKQYELEAASAFTRTFHLKKGGRTVGTVEPVSWWTRQANADLPAELPAEVRIFVAWLVLVMWKRSRDSSSAGS